MLNPRNAIIAAACLFALYVVNGAASALAPKDSAGLAGDSYGVVRSGHRGVFELLERLKVPVERRTLPPDARLSAGATLLLWAPDPLLVRTESRPLQELAGWIRKGGRVVLAPGAADAEVQSQLDQMSSELEHFQGDVLTALELEGVEVVFLKPQQIPKTRGADDEIVISRVASSSTGPADSEIETLATLGSELPVLELEAEIEPRWTTRILDAAGEERILAAALPLGRGEVVIAGDPTLLANACLLHPDNAVWGVRTLTAGAEAVIVDEFYHGLSVRGNAWWLLTQPQYAAVAATVLMLLGVALWRSGVLIGPALESRGVTRRTLGEYLDAMGRLLLRGRDSAEFVEHEVREGVWRRLCREFGVPPATRDWTRLNAAIARTDPQRAEALRLALENRTTSPERRLEDLRQAAQRAGSVSARS